jgi:hypothetical protein
MCSGGRSKSYNNSDNPMTGWEGERQVRRGKVLGKVPTDGRAVAWAGEDKVEGPSGPPFVDEPEVLKGGAGGT